MQDPWSVVTAVLLAVLVGVAVPVLIQVFLTLGTARSLMRRLGPQVQRTLVEVQSASARVNRATDGLDESAKRAQQLLRAAGELGDTVRGLNKSLKVAAAVGGAVGPAVAAALKTLAETRATTTDTDSHTHDRGSGES